MLVVGLTGGIGSGKTTVANMFADRGVPVIDADIIAREVTEPNTPAYFQIVDHFGADLLREDGTFNRSQLRQRIFQDPKERRWLETLLHPLILKEITLKLKKITAPCCLVVIPLLLETGPYPFIQRTLVVDAPEHLQIERVATRDKTSAAQVKAILDTQTQREHRLAQADDVILNDGQLDHLSEQIDQLYAKYTHRPD